MKLVGGAAIVVWLLCASSCFGAPSFDASDYFTTEEIERGARFSRYLYILFLGKQVAVLFFLGLVARSGLRLSYERDVVKLCRGKRRLVLAVYAFFLVLMIRLVRIPFEALRDLVVKGRFGLLSQSVGGWVLDRVKSFLVADIWYIPLVVLVYAAMRRWRRTWWLISAGAVGLGLIAWFSLSPHLFEPLFYRITPVTSEALRTHLDPLLKKSGLDSTALYEAASGKKTKEVNAYTSGLFLGKRIVLYDLLAEEADPSEIRFVVAHEIAHWKHGHILQGIGWATGGAAAGLFLLGTLLKVTATRENRERPHLYGPSSLPAFFFWLHVLLFFSMPVACTISRRFERTADKYALELTQDPRGAIRLFQKVARRNLSDIYPPALAKVWLYTHPTIPERIEAALKAADKFQPAIEPAEPTAPPPEAPSPPDSPPSPSPEPPR